MAKKALFCWSFVVSKRQKGRHGNTDATRDGVSRRKSSESQAAGQPTDRRPSVSVKPEFSTRAGTGAALFAEAIDGRTIHARRFREIYLKITGDLGGRDVQSELSDQVIRRAAALSLVCERFEAAIAQGADIEIGNYLATINALGRVAGALGLARRAVDITPTEELRRLLTEDVADA